MGKVCNFSLRLTLAPSHQSHPPLRAPRVWPSALVLSHVGRHLLFRSTTRWLLGACTLHRTSTSEETVPDPLNHGASMSWIMAKSP